MSTFDREQNREMVDFRKSNLIIKIRRRVNKPILTTDSMIFRSLLKRKNFLRITSFFNEERNIIESVCQ